MRLLPLFGPSLLALGLVRKRLMVGLLLLAFGIRAYNIGSPIIGYQSWRQADTAAIARNFYENGYHLLHPQVDWGGDGPGYVEAEFPIYPFAVSLLYKIGGVAEIWGRFISLGCSLVAMSFLYLLARRYTTRSTALWGCAFFAVLPLGVFYSRAFMPEAALVMCSVAGVYFFSGWVRTWHWVPFFLSAALVASACLLKIQTLYLGLPLLYLAWLRFGRRTLLHPCLWLYALMVLLPVAWWYYHAHQIHLRYGLTFGIWGYGTDKWGNWGLVTSSRYWTRILFDYLGRQHLAYGALPVFSIGLFMTATTKTERLFDFWLIAFLVYLVIVGKGNYAHPHYQVPALPPISVFVGKVYSHFFRPASGHLRHIVLLTACLLATLVLGAEWYRRVMGLEQPMVAVYKLAQKVEQITKETDLIISVGGDPTLLYLSHRKGWRALPRQIDDALLNNRASSGATCLAGLHSSFALHPARLATVLSGERPVVVDNGEYFIVALGRQM